MSNGIAMNHNVAFNCMEASFWWDFQELSHYITWDGNLSALVSLNGVDGACRGMELNMGDGNVAINNVVVYGHNGDENSQGAYVWNADSEGVWLFENNLSHSNRSGLFVWQNTSNNHTIVGHESYNDHLGIFHGAYINSYTYTNCYFYNSLVRVKATSGNSSGVRFEKTVFDGANLKAYVTEIFPSPVASGGDYNAFRECTFKNYQETAVRINTFPISGENTRKHISLIKCNFSGKMVDFTKESAHDSKAFIQPASGGCSIISQAGVTATTTFAPYIYGDGKGLKGEYFNGSNFEDLAFTRIDSMLMFQQWTYDKAASPTQVHHRIKSDRYSMRWTGMVEAQFSESYKFRVQGSGGFRLWIDNVNVIDSWSDRTDNQDSVTSAGINLVAGQKYDIKLEHMNAGGARACQLFWECPSLGRSIHVPQSQLYSDAVLSVVPVQNRAPVAVAGDDVTITLPVNTVFLDGSKSSPFPSIKSYKWQQISGPAAGNIVNTNGATTQVKDLVEGIYLFRLQIVDQWGTSGTDEVVVNVNPVAKNSNPQTPLVANAGPDITLQLPVSAAVLDASASSPLDQIKSYEWTKVSGPVLATITNSTASTTEIKDLSEGTYIYKLQITDKAGNIATDDVAVIVNPAATKPNQQPTLVAEAGADINLTLPTSTVILDGSASSPTSSIKSFEWSKVSGPSQGTIINRNGSSTTVMSLAEGTYVFRLQITDNSGNSATDKVTVTVAPPSATNKTKQAPLVANAGLDTTLTLPTNVAVLDGSASSPSAAIATYEWSQTSGPSKLILGNKNATSLKITELLEGVYVFNLKVTDNDGTVANDEVWVTVKPQPPVANAGPDASISLPVDSVVLNGWASSAPSGIAVYEWTKLSGPSKYRIINKNAISPVIKDLEVGVYVFQLQITDRKGISAVDEVTITVNPGSGANQTGSGNNQPGNGNTNQPGNGNNNQTGNGSNQTGNGRTQTAPINLNITASPNPSYVRMDTIFKVTSNYELPITVKIYNRWGKLEASFQNIRHGSTVRWGAQSQSGSYYAIAEQGSVTKTVQITKL
jgi:hypothetical protein